MPVYSAVVVVVAAAADDDDDDGDDRRNIAASADSRRPVDDVTGTCLFKPTARLCPNNARSGCWNVPSRRPYMCPVSVYSCDVATD